MTSKVVQLLKTLGLERYGPDLVKNQVTIETLLTWDKADFRDLIPPLGPLKVLMDAVLELRRRGDQMARPQRDSSDSKSSRLREEPKEGYADNDSLGASSECNRMPVVMSNLPTGIMESDLLGVLAIIKHHITSISWDCDAVTGHFNGNVTIEFDDERVPTSVVRGFDGYMWRRQPISVN